MNVTQMEPKKKRTPVPIDAEMERLIEAMRRPGTPENAALGELVDRDLVQREGSLSQAATVAALVELGRQVVDDRVLAESYEVLAAEQDDEDRAARVAMRGRLSRRAAKDCS